MPETIGNKFWNKTSVSTFSRALIEPDNIDKDFISSNLSSNSFTIL